MAARPRGREADGRAATSGGRRASPTRSTPSPLSAGACTSCWRTGAPSTERVELLENLRYNPGEEANDPAFVASLVENQDLYVDDAFGAAHRAHASIVGPPAFLPSAAGRVLAREVEVLDGLLQKPKRPFVAVLGGAKVSDKLGVIEALLDKVDAILVGGGMCFTFLAAQGHDPGGSLLEHGQVDNCARLLAAAQEAGKRIVVPTDIVVLSPDGVFGKGRATRRRDGHCRAGRPGGVAGPGHRPRYGGRLR